MLGLSRLKELLHPGKTLGDVAARHAPRMEGTHGQLGARLADRLGRDDAHRLADAHPGAGGEVGP